MTTSSANRVLQMRLVVEVDDYDDAVAFYRDVLGAREELVVDSDGGASVTILDVGRATLELSNPGTGRPHRPDRGGQAGESAAARRLRGGRRGRVSRDLVAGGAELIAEPTVTPWQSLNARLQAPADLQISVFQELADESPDSIDR